MSKIIGLLVVVFALCLTACNDEVKKEAAKIASPIVGGDADGHGCIGPAGYTWSVVKDSCIRIFDSGIRLNAKAPGLDTVTSAFVVFKSETDDARAELFLPTQRPGILLTKDKTVGAGKWTNAAFTLSQWKGMYTLEDDKKKTLYQGSAATTDGAAIVHSLHGFYTWYDANSGRIGKINFFNEKGKYLKLDDKRLQLYLAEVKKSGFVSDELIANETKFYQACAKLWVSEPKDEVHSGTEADRFLCAQDFIAPYNTGSVSSVVNGDRAKATLTLSGQGGKSDFTYEMKKENGQWLIAKLGCDMGLKY